MTDCPYTDEQVAEIEVLESIAGDITEFVYRARDTRLWITQILNVPQALLAPTEGLGAHALEEADAHPASWMGAELARASFKSYLGVVRALKDDPETLRTRLREDNLRLEDIIIRMAECAGLHDNATEPAEGETDDDWTGFREDASNFLWAMPNGDWVRAIPESDECGVIWGMWVRRGPLMYCPFSVGIEDFSDPEGNPGFERCAWSAWHDSILVLDAMEKAAGIKLSNLNDTDFELVFDDEE